MDMLYREAEEQLPIEFQNLNDLNSNLSYEKLINGKYRLKPSELGEYGVAHHWFEELA